MKRTNDLQLNKDKIKTDLSNQWKNLEIFVSNETSSTNDLAKIYAKQNIDSPALFITRRQTKGRGRHGRSFYSAIDTGLYFSLVIHPGNIKTKDVPIYTILAATTLLQTIKKNFNLNLQVKWVNDLFYNHRKVSGILCESIMDSQNMTVSSVVIGIGLNLAGHFKQADSKTKKIAGTLFDNLPKNLNMNLFLKDFLDYFEYYQNQIPENDFLKVYNQHLLGVGEEVFYIQENTKKTGIILGVNKAGNLLIQQPNGKIQTLYGQDIHFSSHQFLNLN